MLVQLFLSASAAVLVSAQFGAPPAAPPGCTSNSFTLPSWLVQNFESSDGKAAFHLINRATNGTADLTCAVSGSGWSACSAEGKSDLEASIRIDGNKANLKVNETWVCKDRPGGERFTFSGAATSEFALSCAAGKPCVSTNPQILLKATLSSPISATPAYLEGPTGHDLAGCKATSQSPTWTVSMVYFVDQKGDGISAMPTTSVNLAFTNDANQYQVSCMVGNLGLGDDDPTAADGLIPLTCAGYEFQSFTTGRYALSTAANFDPKTMTLNLNQTWYCDDTDPGRPTVIKGSASQVLDLNCTDTVAYGFPRKTCAVSADLKVKGKLGSEDPLTPFSIADPMPAGDGCTVSSIFAPKWTLSAFEIDGKEAANVSGSVSFNIILATGSQGFQYPIAITQGAAVNGSAGWHECEVGPDGGIGQPLWPYRCAFKYDAAAKELTLDADWMCTDIDPKHPVLFTGVTTTTVNSTLACDTADGLSRCQTTDPFFSWAAPISNVTWKAGP